MANFGASLTPQLKVVKEWSDAYTSLDMNRHGPPTSKNYKYEHFPKTPDLPEEEKEEHAERLKKMMSSMTKFEVNVHEVIEAPGKVVIHTTTMCSTVDGATLSCDSVCILTLIEEDGELKILHCKDFSDPQQRSAFIAGTTKGASAS